MSAYSDWAFGDANPEVKVNAGFDSLGQALVFAERPEAHTGLTVGYGGGDFDVNTVADGTVAGLTDNTTNYLVVHRTTRVVTSSTATANWNATSTYGRMARAVFAAGVLTWHDERSSPGGIFDHGAGTGLLAANNLSDVANAATARTNLGVDTAIAAAVAGLSWKQAVRAASTAALTLASNFENGDTIDGVVIATADRILIKNQASATENGIYVVAASGAPARATDADSGAELVNASVYVSEGTTLADTQWTCATNATITIGATNIAFAQLTSGGGVTSVDASGGVQTASGSPITATGTIRGAHVRNAQTGTTYAVVAGDRGKHVTLTNAASIAASIDQAGTTGFEDGYFAILENIGVGAVTLTPTTSTVNGAATLVLASGMTALVSSDGTNYRALVFGRGGVPVNLQTGTTYTYLSGDRGQLVTHTNAAAIAGTLPQATGAFGAGWSASVQNRGAGTLTITPTTSTIDGAASLALTANQGCLIVSDGTNYYTLRGIGGSGGGSTQGRHSIPIAAGSMAPSVAVGCQSLERIVTTANQPDIASLNFDATTAEYAQFSLSMPKSWDEGTVTFCAIWSHAATATNFGVVWELQAYAASDDDAIATAYGSSQSSTDTGGTTNDIYKSPESGAITIAGTPAAEDTVFFRLLRAAANGSDTLAIDARLMGLVLYITTNADTDA